MDKIFGMTLPRLFRAFNFQNAYFETFGLFIKQKFVFTNAISIKKSK